MSILSSLRERLLHLFPRSWQHTCQQLVFIKTFERFCQFLCPGPWPILLVACLLHFQTKNCGNLPLCFHSSKNISTLLSGLPLLWLWVQGDMWVETKRQEFDRGRVNVFLDNIYSMIFLLALLNYFPFWIIIFVYTTYSVNMCVCPTFRVLSQAASTTGTTRTR